MFSHNLIDQALDDGVPPHTHVTCGQSRGGGAPEPRPACAGRNVSAGVAVTHSKAGLKVTAISGNGGTSHAPIEIELFESQRRFTSTRRAIAPDFFGLFLETG